MAPDLFGQIKSSALTRLLELSPSLTYHCLEHTLDVLEQSIRIAKAESIDDERELFLLKVAALYHDTGFLRTYKMHEQEGCAIFLEDAPVFNFPEEDKETVIRLIMATQIPQRPVTLTEKIICDADLDYLGRPDFFDIGDTLRREFLHYNIVKNNEEWETIQIKFLQAHHYHTASSQAIREPVKQQNISRLLAETT